MLLSENHIIVDWFWEGYQLRNIFKLHKIKKLIVQYVQ